jgi:hypothetical protein
MTSGIPTIWSRFGWGFGLLCAGHHPRGPHPEAHCYALAVMSPEQALELMTQKLSEPLNEAEKAQALTFASGWGTCP